MTTLAHGEFEHIARPRSEALDTVLGLPYAVLDHGFIRVIDYMGDESAICQAARVSYGQGTKSVTEDRGLLRYLMRHHHTTPFEMCSLKLHVKLPVFVARQWVRHRTAKINEYSARYSILKSEFHLPDPEDLARQSKSNKQGREGAYDADEAKVIRRGMARAYDSAAITYADLIDETDLDLARETAREVLPLATYTEWYWKIDLHNLLHFLRLRADSHAQKEIRAYADVICSLVKAWVPNVWSAFEDYQLNAHTFSGSEMEELRNYIARLEAAVEDEGVSEVQLQMPTSHSKREHDAFRGALEES
tara:strand:+ start:13034 stop:13948 length:915 start_codon:yes stop_codon:yes gene_type:complete